MDGAVDALFVQVGERAIAIGDGGGGIEIDRRVVIVDREIELTLVAETLVPEFVALADVVVGDFRIESDGFVKVLAGAVWIALGLVGPASVVKCMGILGIAFD